MPRTKKTAETKPAEEKKPSVDLDKAFEAYNKLMVNIINTLPKHYSEIITDVLNDYLMRNIYNPITTANIQDERCVEMMSGSVIAALTKMNEDNQQVADETAKLIEDRSKYLNILTRAMDTVGFDIKMQFFCEQDIYPSDKEHYTDEELDVLPSIIAHYDHSVITEEMSKKHLGEQIAHLQQTVAMQDRLFKAILVIASVETDDPAFLLSSIRNLLRK